MFPFELVLIYNHSVKQFGSQSDEAPHFVGPHLDAFQEKIPFHPFKKKKFFYVPDKFKSVVWKYFNIILGFRKERIE